MRVKKVSVDDERNLLTAMITSTEFLTKISQGNFDTSLLSVSYCREVAKWCLEYFEKYSEAPKKNIQDIYKSKRKAIEDEEYTDSIAEFLSALSKDYEQGKNFDFTIEQAVAFLKRKSYENFVEKIKLATEAGEDPSSFMEGFEPFSLRKPILVDSAEDLKNMELPVQRELIPDFLGWGLILFAGAPKIGKSFFLLQLACSVASGRVVFGKYKIKKMPILYLCLEDSRSSIQKRIDLLGFKDEDLSKLKLVYEISRGREGLKDLEGILEQHGGTKIIIIDALATFRLPSNSKNIYQSEYDTMREIKKFADDRRLCIIVAHHTRKQSAHGSIPTDPFDCVNGSMGITGAVNQSVALFKKRQNPNGEILTASRDVKDQYLGVRFEMPGGWTVLGDAEKVRLTAERKEILRLLVDKEEGMQTKEIASELGKSIATISARLSKLESEGWVEQIKYGRYKVKD